MRHPGALDLVGMLGHRLSQEPTGGRDMKALIVLVGTSDSPAQDLAAALGCPEDILEAAWQDVRAATISRIGQEQAQARATGTQAQAAP